MARALIFVTNTGFGENGEMIISGQTLVEGGDQHVPFAATPAWGSSPAAVNQAIEDAAVAAAQEYSQPAIGSGTNDRITLAAAKAL